ncbi:MAG: hypothetical protein Q9169_008271, partial [Polycauliona sp. 2 TL-2023]
IAFFILSALTAMTNAAPQDPVETSLNIPGAITAQDIAQALPVGTIHKLADGEPEIENARVARTHIKVCKDRDFLGRCETLAANKQRCCKYYRMIKGFLREATQSRS